MTKHTNAELREMMERATPGEWSGDGYDRRGSTYWATGPDVSTAQEAQKDARLIAAMRTELGRLLDESEELERLRSRMSMLANQQGTEGWHLAAEAIRDAVGSDYDQSEELASLREQLAAKTEELKRFKSVSLEDLERFDLEYTKTAAYSDFREMVLCPDGEWVRFDDAFIRFAVITERANRILEDAVVLAERLEGTPKWEAAAERILALAKEGAS